VSSIRFSLSAIFLTTVLAISGMGCYSEGVVLAPNAAFDASVTTGVTPLDVQFTDRSDGRGRAIISRLWNFGDGQTSSAVNPSHQYTNPGTYSVTLTISTSAGFDTEIKSNFITVTAPAVAPTANFAASTTSGSAPFTVSFTDTSIAGSEAITSRTWDFGDGGSSIEQNPSHTYTEPGVYTVSLTVTTSAGANTETKDGFITVNANTWSRLLRSPYASGEGSLVDVTTSSDGGMVAVGFGPWSNTDSGAWIIKLDSDGNEEWSRRNGGSNESIYLAVTNTLDGGYAATGAYASSWDSSVRLPPIFGPVR
jgi:PKD repeat protein